MVTQKGALAGLRVVDFTWAAAGPMATLYLALHGAEVIKIESARSMDMSRRGYYTPVDDIEASPNFNDMNMGKLSVRLNMTQPRSAELAKRLIRVSDVVAENFRPGVMERFGLTYEALRAVKPDLVMLSSSTGGQTGPQRDLPGYATTFAALGGLSFITGHEGGPATEIWESVDMRLGTTCVLAIATALYHQRTQGQGQYVDLSSQEVVSSLIGHTFLEFAMTGAAPGRRGNQDNLMAPHNCYPCKGNDRWISIAVGSDEEWRGLCKVMGEPRWTQDSRFADRHGRWRHQNEIDRPLGEWTKGHGAMELVKRLQRAGVAAFPSMDTADLAEDPHLKAREAFMEVPHPKLGMTRPVSPPWRLSKTPAKAERSGPMFGEHVEYVFGELIGLPQREIRALQTEGVLD